ncbi:MAG: arylsulfatase [Armatimonadota bacterium]
MIRTERGARPNIVFILGDDLGYGDIGCFGQRRFATPRIDALAAEGMRLTRHMAGSPVCAPSRCVLMTGLHPGHAPIRDNRDVGEDEQMPVPTGLPILPEILSGLGYACGGFGKWGLGKPGNAGDPLRRGFARFFGYHGQRHAHNHYPDHLDDGPVRVPLANPTFAPHQNLPRGADLLDPATYARFAGREWAPERIVDEACRWIEAHADRPFLCYVPSTIPHLALQAPPAAIAAQSGRHGRDGAYRGGRSYLPAREPRATFAAMVSEFDRHVGRVLDTLSRTGVDRNTIVVFSSDNGPLYERLGGTDTDWFDSAGGLRGRKGDLWEGGVRVPTLVRWTGRIAPGSSSDALTGFEDWLPTLLSMVGAPERIPRRHDGIDLSRHLLGRGSVSRDRWLYREFAGYGGWQGVWEGRWKLVRGGLSKGASSWELYDLALDPRESRDLSAERPELVARLAGRAAQSHQPSPEFPLRGLGDRSRG